MSARGWYRRLAPGILIAATGVGAGDLLTAGLAGARLGVAVIWAAVLGGVLKWVLNEGLARWQMATGTTLLEGWAQRLGAWIRWAFLAYLLLWTVSVGGALVSACGVGGTGLIQLTEDPRHSKIVWGVIHAVAGYVLVRRGGFAWFERIMSVCIAVMFVAVLATAVLIQPDWAAVGRGLAAPLLSPQTAFPSEGRAWVIAVLGGVGGTLTLLSYGYWIQQRQRTGESGLRDCRTDLTVGYAMTSLFGAAMIIIGSRTALSGESTSATELAEQVAAAAGPGGKWVFLVGFWGAVFSSLLGVWQSVPCIFADFVYLNRSNRGAAPPRDLSATRPYRLYLALMTLGAVPLLWVRLEWVQKTYAVLGAMFMPLLALTLLIMNGRSDWVGRRFRSGWLVNALLVGTLVFFAYFGWEEAARKLGGRS